MADKKAVLFDLDGTLLNSLPDIARCMNRALSLNGLPEHPLDAYRYFTGNGALTLARRAVGEKCQDRAAQVLQSYSPCYSAHCFDESCLYEGIPKMISMLRDAGLRLAVFSNKDDGDVERVIRHYFPVSPFAMIRGRLEGVPLKPDPAGALQIAREMGLQPSDFWYLGDTPVDLRTCVDSGMRFIAAGWGFRTPQELKEAGAECIAMTPLEAARIMLEDLS